MAIVKLFGNLREHVDASPFQIPGASIRAVLESACEGNSALREALLEDGIVRPHFKITLNGRDIELAQRVATPVGPDDQIAIFPPIAGG